MNILHSQFRTVICFYGIRLWKTSLSSAKPWFYTIFSHGNIGTFPQFKLKKSRVFSAKSLAFSIYILYNKYIIITNTEKIRVFHSFHHVFHNITAHFHKADRFFLCYLCFPVSKLQKERI